MSTGIWPSGNRVVVQPDEVERVSEGGIIIPDADADKYQMAQSTGTLLLGSFRQGEARQGRRGRARQGGAR